MGCVRELILALELSFWPERSYLGMLLWGWLLGLSAWRAKIVAGHHGEILSAFHCVRLILYIE